MMPPGFRTYIRKDVVAFSKTKDPFGGLSNMAAGYPLRVNSEIIRTSEAIYQACRFPHRPEVQKLVIDERSPMSAKMATHPYRHDSRPDWIMVRIPIMRWALRLKLIQNWNSFARLLLATEDRLIVEESKMDDFWGAIATGDQTLEGQNVLGRLLMELREVLRTNPGQLLTIKPPAISSFTLYGQPITEIARLSPAMTASMTANHAQIDLLSSI